jgi:hypothetical protein
MSGPAPAKGPPWRRRTLSSTSKLENVEPVLQRVVRQQFVQHVRRWPAQGKRPEETDARPPGLSLPQDRFARVTNAQPGGTLASRSARRRLPRRGTVWS